MPIGSTSNLPLTVYLLDYLANYVIEQFSDFRKWQEFVDCVKRYTDLCFTESKRKEFNKAVESPVDLVHQMCTSSDYQQGLCEKHVFFKI